MDQQAWVRAHAEAFSFYNGVVRRIVLDNLRAGVVKPDIYDPKLNRAYAELGAYCGCLLDPARVGHPKDKACASDYSLLIRSGTKSSRPSRQPVVNARNSPAPVLAVMLRGGCDSSG
jgi:transposase